MAFFGSLRGEEFISLLATALDTSFRRVEVGQRNGSRPTENLGLNGFNEQENTDLTSKIMDIMDFIIKKWEID